MRLEPYVESIRRQLELAAEAGGEDARALAERLLAPLEAAIRLALQDALADAVEDITLELAPGSVELRLRGRNPEFVVTLPPAPAYGDEDGDDATAVDWPPRRTEPRDGAQRDDDDSVARINLRLPERLKARVEQAAADEGVSVNSWLVRTTASAVERGDPNRRSEPRTGYGAQRYRGWAR
jgi:HicB family